MERMIRLTAVALIFTVAFTMQAQPSGAGGRGPGGMIIPVMAALDEDKDGVISASEIQNAEKSLTALDKNGDGKIDNNELFSNFDANITTFELLMNRLELLTVTDRHHVWKLV